MNENHEEKKLNDDRLTGVTGGEGEGGYIFNASYVCPMCGRGHRCKFTVGNIMHGYHYDFVDEGNHCEKIKYMYDIDSFDPNKKIGKISLMTTGGKIVSTVFFWVD